MEDHVIFKENFLWLCIFFKIQNNHPTQEIMSPRMPSMPVTSVRRSWPMQIVKSSLYVIIELLRMTDVSLK